MDKKDKKRRRSIRILTQSTEKEEFENTLVNDFEATYGSIWKDFSPNYISSRRRSMSRRRSGIFKPLPVPMLEEGIQPADLSVCLVSRITSPYLSVSSTSKVDSPELSRAPDNLSENNSLNVNNITSAVTPDFSQHENRSSSNTPLDELIMQTPKFSNGGTATATSEGDETGMISTEFESPDYPEGIFIGQNNAADMCQSPLLSRPPSTPENCKKKKFSTPCAELKLNDSVAYSPSQPVFSTPSLNLQASCSDTPYSSPQTLFETNAYRSASSPSDSELSEPSLSLQQQTGHKKQTTGRQKQYSSQKHSAKKQKGKLELENSLERREQEKKETSRFFSICKSLATKIANVVRKSPENDNEKMAANLDNTIQEFVTTSENKVSVTQENFESSTNYIDCDTKLDFNVEDGSDKEMKDEVHSVAEEQILVNKNVNENVLENFCVTKHDLHVDLNKKNTIDGDSNENSESNNQNEITGNESNYSSLNNNNNNDIKPVNEECTIIKSVNSEQVTSDEVRAQTEQTSEVNFNQNSDSNWESTEIEGHTSVKDSEDKKKCQLDDKNLEDKIDLHPVESHCFVKHSVSLNPEISTAEVDCILKENKVRKRGRPRLKSAEPLINGTAKMKSTADHRSDKPEIFCSKYLPDEDILKSMHRSTKGETSPPAVNEETASVRQEMVINSILAEEIQNVNISGLDRRKRRTTTRRKFTDCALISEVSKEGSSVDPQTSIDRDRDRDTGEKRSDQNKSKDVVIEANTEHVSMVTEYSNILMNHIDSADFDKIQEFLSMDEEKPVTKKGRSRRRSADAVVLSDIAQEEENSDISGRRNTRLRRRSIEIYHAGESYRSSDSENLSDSANVVDENDSPNTAAMTTKPARKRKIKEENVEDIYRNKNFKQPEERLWETIFECPDQMKNPDQLHSKKRFKRTISFQTVLPSKMKKRIKRAADIGWDAKKRKKIKLSDEIVIDRLAELDDLLKV